MSHKERQHKSDMTDKQWQLIQPLLPLEHDGPGRPLELDMRQVVNAIFYVVRTGCQWEYLPGNYPNYNSVYYHYRKWCLNGLWQQINQRLRQQERQSQGREPEPTGAVIDTQSVKTTEAGGQRGFDGGKQVNGRKRHLITDTLGNVLTTLVHAANVQDCHGAKPTLLNLSQETLNSLKKIWADGSYRGELVTWVHEQLDIILEITLKDRHQKGFQVLPKRWVIERTFAWLGRYRRLSKDYEHCTFSSEGVIYIASIHSMLRRLCC